MPHTHLIPPRILLDLFTRFVFSHTMVKSLVTVQPRGRTITSIERKPRMRQIRGIKGEAVVNYCEPMITKEMAYHRFSQRVNKMEINC